ncbi:MAG: hypothetical protein QOH39_2173 [Verrucomicrobiota bacterium]|jgi:hypothetical protein
MISTHPDQVFPNWRRPSVAFLARLRVACLLPVIAASFLVAQGLAAGTYYIDFVGGSDASAGTNKSTPWKRCPGMSGFSGTYIHQAGDHFIFKGGVTWLGLGIAIANNGAVGNPDYYGVDQTWFTGGSWARPKFDYAYNTGTGINLGSQGYVTFDNIEMCHVSSNQSQGTGLIVGYAPVHLTVKNCYLHGWRTTAAKDDAHGGIIFTQQIFAGNETNIIDNCEIENLENLTNGLCVRAMGTIRNSHIHHNSSAILFCVDFDHNEIDHIGNPTSFDPTAHENGVYLDPQAMNQTVGYIRNSKFHDMDIGANMAYPNPRFATIHIYNNLFYGTQSGQLAINIDPYDYGANATSGAVYCYNNTFVNYFNNEPAIHSASRGWPSGPRLAKLVCQNNHVIGTGAFVTDASSNSATAGSLTGDHNLIQTPAVASGQGYNSGNLWRPTSQGDATVGTGVIVPNNLFTTDMLGVLRIGTWDIGAYQYNGVTPTPTPAPTSTPATTPTPTVAPSPTASPSPVPSPTPSPSPLGLSFGSTAGMITAPFIVNSDNTISQSLQTVDPTQGGRAVYNFNVPSAGDYAVSANVDAPTEGNNSVFFNIDAEPVSPTMIWDISMTTGLEQRIASWRGDGTDVASQFDPKIFSLSQGVHQLIIVGREAGTRIQQIVIQKVPAPPLNLRPSG